ncbi:hypothetical protein BGLA2_310041 [Burkholderia gladioli]|nr:hypothetical protein BGLA2_310041 [Burkholderia gladioli]
MLQQMVNRMVTLCSKQQAGCRIFQQTASHQLGDESSLSYAWWTLDQVQRQYGIKFLQRLLLTLVKTCELRIVCHRLMRRPDSHARLSQHLKQLNVIFQGTKSPCPASEEPIDTHVIASTKIQV